MGLYRSQKVRKYKEREYNYSYWIADLSLYDGKRRQRISGTGSTRAQAQRQLQENLRKRYTGERKPNGPQGAITLDQWFDKWLTTCLANGIHKKQTSEQHRVRYDEWIADTLGNIPLAKLTSDSIQDLINDVAKHGHAIGPNIYKTMNAVLNAAVEAAQIKQNPMVRVVKPKQRSKAGEADVAHLEHWSRIAAEMVGWLKDPKCPLHDRYPFIFALFLGLRRAELLGLEFSCFHDHMSNVLVKQQLIRNNDDGSYYIQDSTKTGKSRKIMLPDMWRDAFKQQQEQRNHITPADDKWSDLVFLTEKGTPITYSIYNKLWKETIETYIRMTNQKWDDTHYFRPHTCRKLTASWLACTNVNLQIAQSVLGHQSEAIHLYYTVINGESQKKAMANLEDIFKDPRQYLPNRWEEEHQAAGKAST